MNTAPATRGISSVKDLLRSEAAFQQIESVAANNLSGERMARVMANAVRTTPALQDCEPMSFLGAMMTAASLGLEPNTSQGHAYLVPFNNNRKIDGRWVKIKEVQLIIGYKGFIDLAFRSGVLTYIDAGVHYSDDELWQYEKGMNFTLRHVEGSQKGQKLHAYSIVKWSNGNGADGFAAAVLPWSKVLSTRDQSQNWQVAVRNGNQDKNPWATHEDAMAIKTAIRALANTGRMPMSVEMRNAIAVDGNPNANFRGVASDPSALKDGSIVGGFGSPDIDPEGFIDGEAEDVGQEEKKDPPKDKPKADPKPKQEERPKEDPKPKEDADGDDKAGDEHDVSDEGTSEDEAPQKEESEGSGSEDAEEDEDRKQATKAHDTIIADLMDAGADGVPKVFEEHKKALDTIQKRHKDLWENIQSFIDDL
ncbi:MAG: recombinase RecT [Pseudomonadales bacterium]|nr:recombinase RecT [Pseudomonadales bacterium]